MASSLEEAFEEAKRREEEKQKEQSTNPRCTICRKPLMECNCTRHSGLGWLESESSGV